MTKHRVVDRETWLQERREFLAEEKAFTRQRDALSKKRRELPWVALDKDYAFEGDDGRETLSELFGDCDQLLVYHFMYGPDWKEGCPSCSFWADNFNGIDIHLAHRGIRLVAISKAPFERLKAYRDRMGWSFKWLSSFDSDFNEDFAVSFPSEQVESGDPVYNFGTSSFSSTEAPGASAFFKDPDGTIYHTYSTFSRGLDMLNGAYHYMDIAPKGRDEQDLSYAQAWLRRRDQYED